MATYSSILAWRIPWTEESGGLWSKGSQRVRHDWATITHHSVTFIKSLFSSSSLSAIRVVRSAYLRLLIFLLTILILEITKMKKMHHIHSWQGSGVAGTLIRWEWGAATLETFGGFWMTQKFHSQVYIQEKWKYMFPQRLVIHSSIVHLSPKMGAYVHMPLTGN